PPGRDGGVDVIAYKDPLGTVAPRIKVQIKHKDQKVSVREVRELEAILRKEGDIGLIVSSGGFTSEVERENLHVVKDMRAGAVQLQSGEIFDPFSILAFDERKDLVVLQIAGFDLPAMDLGNSNEVKAGEPVI